MVYAHFSPTHWPFLMNVVFSLLTGLAAVTGFGTLSEYFGLPGWLVAAIGTVLILFAGTILLMLVAGRLNGWWTAFISGADLAWVAGWRTSSVGRPEELALTSRAHGADRDTATV